MKKLILAAALVASFSAASFEANNNTKAVWLSATLEQTKGMEREEFCRLMGDFAYQVEGTAPDSVERGIDYGMVGAHAIYSRHWSVEQRAQCTRWYMESFRNAADLAEGEE